MSTIKEIIERVDLVKPNDFSQEQKVRWIAELDGKIALQVFLMAHEEASQFQYAHPEALEQVPLVKFPHDNLYDRWLECRIDFQNGEYERYQNSLVAYNECYEDYLNWICNSYAPAQGDGCDIMGHRPGVPSYYITAYGLAINRGFIGTLDEWLLSLKGEKGDKGDQGIQGIQGIQGPVGPMGPKGEKGEQGIQGLQGIQGPIGPAGPKGDKGNPGDGIGRLSDYGGSVFNDYNTNRALALYATTFGSGTYADAMYSASFGYQSITKGTAAFATGTITYTSGAVYATDNQGRYYVVSENSPIMKDCDVLAAGHVVVGPGGLGSEYVQTSDGGFVQKADIRGNEAVGSGAMASGMGAIAFARASKSLGYRTQTGYPTDPKYLSERPELQVLTEKLQFTADTEAGTAANQFNTATVNPWPLYTDLGVSYINKMAVRITNYSCGISGSAKVYLRFAFANKCCTDFPTTDVELRGSTDVPLSLDSVIQVPEGATQCSIYVVHTGTGSASGEIFDLTVTKFPLDNLNQAAFAIGADNAALGKHSFAGGLRSIARGDNSFAFGFNDPGAAVPTWTEANGAFSFALGLNCQTNAMGSLAFGDGNVTNAAYSVALGQLNATNKALSYALGKQNETNGIYSLALGLQNLTTAKNTLAIGEGNSAENDYAVAIGQKSHAYGIGSFAAGQGSIAGAKVWDEATQKYKLSGTGAASFGVGNEANFYGAFSYGQGNVSSNYNTIAGGSLSKATMANSAAIGRGVVTGRASQMAVGQWNVKSTKALFVVGNGSDEDVIDETGKVTKQNRSTAFQVLGNGEIVLGVGCFGNALPSTGVKGQLYFVKV